MKRTYRSYMRKVYRFSYNEILVYWFWFKGEEKLDWVENRVSYVEIHKFRRRKIKHNKITKMTKNTTPQIKKIA